MSTATATKTRKTVSAKKQATQAVVDHLTAALRAAADAEHAQYPQYAGHWDNWTLVEITRRVRTKLGVAFEAGDLVLLSPEVRTEKVPPRGRFEPDYDKWPEQTFRTAYSARNHVDTTVRPEWIREVEIVTE